MDETLPSKKPDRRKGYGRLEETQVPAEFEESRNSLLQFGTDEDTSLNRPTGKSQNEPEVEMQIQQSSIGRDDTAIKEELIDDTRHIGTQDR